MNILNHHKCSFAAVSTKSIILLSSLLLSGCAGSTGVSGAASTVAQKSAGAPVSLFAKKTVPSMLATSAPVANAPTATSLAPAMMARVRHSLNQVAIRRAIRNYRITKKQPEGPYRVMGADLNTNGKGEAIVLFTGEGWCAPTGCTLAVFGETDRGYRIISLTRRVKAPIYVARQSAFGWRGLTVDTGIKDRTLQSVILKFNGSRYPGNATLVPRIPGRGGDKGELLIGADANPVTAAPEPQQFSQTISSTASNP